MLVAVPTIIWSCTPVRKSWQPHEEGHCINYYAQCLAVALFDVLLDLLILLLPMPQVFRLQMKLSRKLLTAAVFASGYWYVSTTPG